MSETTSSGELFDESFDRLLGRLREQSADLDTADSWPESQLSEMSDAGVLSWLIPEEFGGREISSADLTIGYERLAEACLVSTFVLTQRNAAIQRIVKSENEELKAELLPQLADDSLFTTVGISHLTTSRQHWKQPTVQVEQVDAGFIMSGEVPWVTGADKADIIVCGGTLLNNKQVLVAVEKVNEGIEYRPAAELMALNASRTVSVGLSHVFIPLSHVLHGPVEQVMKHGGGGAGSYTTSALAIGHAAAAIRMLRDESERRSELSEILEPFELEHSEVSFDLHRAIRSADEDSASQCSAEAMRQRSNSLALRASQACMAASKGAGFVNGHPAGRLVREAMFFLVWSCPQPVVMANMREFAGVCEES